MHAAINSKYNVESVIGSKKLTDHPTRTRAEKVKILVEIRFVQHKNKLMLLLLPCVCTGYFVYTTEGKHRNSINSC